MSEVTEKFLGLIATYSEKWFQIQAPLLLIEESPKLFTDALTKHCISLNKTVETMVYPELLNSFQKQNELELPKKVCDEFEKYQQSIFRSTLVFSHSHFEAYVTDLIKLIDLIDCELLLKKYSNSEIKTTVTELEKKGIVFLKDDARKKFLKKLERYTLIERVELFLSLTTPPKEWLIDEKENTFQFSIEHIKKIDAKRHSIIHDLVDITVNYEEDIYYFKFLQQLFTKITQRKFNLYITDGDQLMTAYQKKPVWGTK